MLSFLQRSESSSDSDHPQDNEDGSRRGSATPEPPPASPIGQSPVPMDTSVAIETKDGSSPVESRTVEGLFGDAVDLSSS